MIGLLWLFAVGCLALSWRLLAYARSRRAAIVDGQERHPSAWTVICLIAGAELAVAALVFGVAGVMGLLWDDPISAREFILGGASLLGAILFSVWAIAYAVRGGRYYQGQERTAAEVNEPTIRLWPGGITIWSDPINPPNETPGYLGLVFSLLISGVLLVISLTLLW